MGRLRGRYDGVDGIVELAQLLLSQSKNLVPKGRQAVLPLAFEKRLTKVVFQLLQGHRQSRLCPPQPKGGVGEVAGLSDRPKATQHLDLDQNFKLSEINFNNLSLTDS